MIGIKNPKFEKIIQNFGGNEICTVQYIEGHGISRPGISRDDCINIY